MNTSYEANQGKCSLFQFDDSVTENYYDAESHKKMMFDQSRSKLSDLMRNDCDTDTASCLPSAFKKDARKKWLHQFSQKLSQKSILIYSDHKFYVFTGLFHEPYNEDVLNGIISNFLIEIGFSPTASEINFVVNNLRTLAPSKPHFAPANQPDFFLYYNGLVNIHTASLQQNNDGYFATGAIAAYFNPQLINCHPVFDAFLNEITEGNPVMIQRIWEVLAYAISPQYCLRVIFCLIGVGGAGKSVLLRLIQELLTPSLVSDMSIANLTSGRFAVSELENKRVCIASDEGNFNFNEQSAALLKRLSGGGETITADVKQKQQTTFLATAKLLIASNYPIHRSAAAIDPYLRSRMMIIPFIHTVPPEKQDPFLFDKILTERDAIVTRAFFVYLDLKRKNFKFAGEETYCEHLANIATATTSYETIKIFSDNFCIFDETYFITTEELFAAYTAAFPNVLFKSTSAFSRAFLEANYGKIEPKRKHTSDSNFRGFSGVTLRGGNENEF